MSKKIHTIQSSDKKEFDKEVNLFLELGCELHDGGYEVIKNDDGTIYSQVVVLGNCEVEFHDNGQIRYFNNKNKDGNKEGKEIDWYENGQKWNDSTYKNGEIDGKYSRWFETGQKEVDAEYKDGLLDGLCTVWYENGNKKREGKFKNGKVDVIRLESGYDSWGRDGRWYFWYPDGQLLRQVEYKDGEICGKFFEWYNNGNMKIKGECAGEGVLLHSDFEHEYKIKNGLWIEWWENGQKYSEGIYKDGKRVSVYFWDEDGVFVC